MQTVPVSDSRADTELERLIRENQVSLRRLCFLYLHDESLADDAVQDTFLKAYQAWDSYRQEASEKTWLTRIAINTCKNMLHSAWFRRVDRTMSVDSLPGQAGMIDQESSETAVVVMNLPRKLREVIILYYYQGIDTCDIADMLGITQPAVSGRLKRARERLRNELKGCDIDEE